MFLQHISRAVEDRHVYDWICMCVSVRICDHMFGLEVCFFFRFSFNPVLPKGYAYFHTLWKDMITEKEKLKENNNIKKALI